MLGRWFKAQRDRRYADDALTALSFLELKAEEELRRLDDEVQPQLRRQAVLRIVSTVIDCERTEQDVHRWRAIAERERAAGRLFRSIGISVGTRLVAAGVLVSAMPEGRERSSALLALSQFEALLLALCKHYNVRAWRAGYAYVDEFEAWRRDRLEEQRATDADTVAWQRFLKHAGVDAECFPASGASCNAVEPKGSRHEV